MMAEKYIFDEYTEQRSSVDFSDEKISGHQLAWSNEVFTANIFLRYQRSAPLLRARPAMTCIYIVRTQSHAYTMSTLCLTTRCSV